MLFVQIHVIVLAVCMWACTPNSDTHTEGPKNETWTGVSGVVTLEGKPVTYFGVTVVPSSRYWIEDPLTPDRRRAAYLKQIIAPKVPIRVHSNDGTFAIETPPGQWDLILAGPGFARYVVRGATARPRTGATLDIKVTRGRTINGTVTYGGGAPVDHAQVRITQTDSCPREDSLWELACGNHSTFTKSDGSFKISNFAEVYNDAFSTIAASVGDYASLPHRVDDSGTFIRLEVFPSGSMEGSLLGAVSRNEQVLIVAKPVSGGDEMISVDLKQDGSFRFEKIPVGEYYVGAWRFELREPALLSRRVTVVANSSTFVVLTTNTQ